MNEIRTENKTNECQYNQLNDESVGLIQVRANHERIRRNENEADLMNEKCNGIIK